MNRTGAMVLEMCFRVSVRVHASPFCYTDVRGLRDPRLLPSEDDMQTAASCCSSSCDGATEQKHLLIGADTGRRHSTLLRACRGALPVTFLTIAISSSRRAHLGDLSRLHTQISVNTRFKAIMVSYSNASVDYAH